MKRLHTFIIFVMALLFIVSCSRKKDKFINRNWHALNTKYNTLYNGGVAFDEGREKLIETYQDNYWKQLPIERLEVRDEIYLNTDNKDASFARAEEKAVKAIQKHSMNIRGWERNSQIDEAFMLLGKARYFDQRFVQALEAFNYILYKYPSSNNINQARVWKAKTLIRLDNNEGALNSLKKILITEKVKMEKQEWADANAMLAQAYVNLKHKDSAIAPMKIAVENTQSNEEKGRYHYILGQLYNRVRERDSANMEFDKIINLNRRVPREYLVNAFLAKARNLEIESDDQIAFLDILNKLEKNWENRPFLDKIYYEKAIFFFGIDSMKIAEEYYQKSLKTRSQDKYLNSLSYETLGRINFNRKMFETAGAYMDSTLVLLDENSKRYRVIKKKRDNLDDVIKYEAIVKHNDSVLKLAALSPANQLVYFKNYTDSIKTLKRNELKRQRNAKFNSKQLLNTATASIEPRSKNDKEQFYFYNPSIVENGKAQFLAIFGERDLVDNWNVASLTTFASNAEAVEVEKDDYDIDADAAFDPQQYISQIPTDKSVLDSLKLQLNEAYFELGVVYKEQLKEYDIAADKFEFLLSNNPQEKYIMPAKYNLYKIYQSVGNFVREDKMRADILQNHPDSRYAKIVKDPFQEVDTETNKVEADYTRIYRLYENQDYLIALSDLDAKIKKYGGDPIVAKFELLKALTLGKVYGVDKMTELLNYVAITYPKLDEGKKATELLQGAVPSLQKIDFEIDKNGDKKYKVLYPFDRFNAALVENLKKEVDSVIKNRNFGYKSSIDFYDENKKFLVIHGLKGKQQASGMRLLLNDSTDSGLNLTQYNPVSISSNNYRVIQAKKNFEQYLQIRDSIYYQMN